MAEGKVPKRLERRAISGSGILRFPESDVFRHYWVYVNIIRFPPLNWLNSKWNPDRSEYAKMAWMQKEYVCRESTLNFPSQLYEWSVDPYGTGYLALALACILEQMSAQFQHNAIMSGFPPLAPGGKLYIEPLRSTPTQINFVCVGSTAIEVDLWGLEYDVNCPSAKPTPKPPPNPPPRPPIPPNSPIGDITPPYDEDDPSDITEPWEGDLTAPPTFNEFPFGDACKAYRVSYRMVASFDPSNPDIVDTYSDLWGELEEVIFNGDIDTERSFGIVARGIFGQEECGESRYIQLQGFSSIGVPWSVEIITVEELP